MKKKKRFSLKEQYVKSWNYIKSSRKSIYAIILIFVLFVLIGFFVPVSGDISKMLVDYLKELVNKTEGFGTFRLIWFIFLNNVQSGFAGMIFGFFLGIFPVIVAVFNGFILGFVSGMAVQQKGGEVLLTLVPHGIFELPAIFISLGLGLKFGSFLFNKKPSEKFKEYLWESIRVFIFVIVPLLIIAAIIEGSLIQAGI